MHAPINSPATPIARRFKRNAGRLPWTRTLDLGVLRPAGSASARPLVKEPILVGDQDAPLAAGRLTQYPELQSFLADPASKAAEEVAFWTGPTARATAADLAP